MLLVDYSYIVLYLCVAERKVSSDKYFVVCAPIQVLLQAGNEKILFFSCYAYEIYVFY